MQEPGWRLNNGTGKQPEAVCTLVETRRKIDELDRQIAIMLSERLKLAKRLSLTKETLGLPIQDPEQEAKVLGRLSDRTRDSEIAAAIQKIYLSVMAQSRNLQAKGTRRRH